VVAPLLHDVGLDSATWGAEVIETSHTTVDVERRPHKKPPGKHVLHSGAVEGVVLLLLGELLWNFRGKLFKQNQKKENGTKGNTHQLLQLGLEGLQLLDLSIDSLLGLLVSLHLAHSLALDRGIARQTKQNITDRCQRRRQQGRETSSRTWALTNSVSSAKVDICGK